MNGVGEIGGGEAILNGDNRFSDQVTRARPHDATTKQSAIGRIHGPLGKSFRPPDRLGPTAGTPGVGGRFQLLVITLLNTDPGDFRVGEDNCRDQAVRRARRGSGIK